VRWRAWYANGREYSSKDSLWQKLPKQGCVIVKWWPNCGDDSIIRIGDEFFSVNLPTREFETLAGMYATRGMLKFGELMESQAYAAIYERALAAEAPEA
jgi:acetyl-CoA acetyltransferase